MAANFVQKIVISVKSTNISVSILPKTKSFKVLCVFIAKTLTMEKRQKPKLTISVRQLLFIIDLYYSTLNNDIIHYQ